MRKIPAPRYVRRADSDGGLEWVDLSTCVAYPLRSFEFGVWYGLTFYFTTDRRWIRHRECEDLCADDEGETRWESWESWEFVHPIEAARAFAETNSSLPGPLQPFARWAISKNYYRWVNRDRPPEDQWSGPWTEDDQAALALLEAHLQQPISFATIQQEKQATGHSPTEAAHNKLKLIRDFNRRLHQPDMASTSTEPAPVVVSESITRAAQDDESSLALLRLFTNGVVDDRISNAKLVLADDKLTVNEKLTKIDALIPFPATASAEQLGEMLGKSKQAVLKSEWWKQNRQGEKENEIGRRRTGHKARAKTYEAPAPDRDDD